MGMLRYRKKQFLSAISTLEKTNGAVRAGNVTTQDQALDLLSQCQGLALEMGNELETRGEAGQAPVKLLEEYCELLYQQSLVFFNAGKRAGYSRRIRKLLASIAEEIKYGLPEDKREVVFFPYKASMWDSLESIWMAARGDEGCEAYVVPIPYFDRNPDNSLGRMHYEGGDYPEYVEVIDWQVYDLEVRRPDMIFIHNPYDDWNLVTSVHPRYYSSNLKEVTDELVYVPYYISSGGMSEGQQRCPAYYHADHIIIQSEKYRKFFDAALFGAKLCPLGSPKYDRVIRKCSNPPEPPDGWREKLAGKKIYFYNTSIGGMLEDTGAFLKKMAYVFHCFEERAGTCLLWRPHPLLASTFDSMRPQYKPYYESLKQYFLEKNLGIYDNTPDISDVIALCDAYIGDAETSVTSLFGIVGKPLFILDNHVHTPPGEDDWKAQMVTGVDYYGNARWIVTQGNKLYYSSSADYQYRYLCDLSEYAYGDYYGQVIEMGGDAYVCPVNAQDIVVAGENGIKKRIPLERRLEQGNAFVGAIRCGDYLLLIPSKYPAVVRYDTRTGEVSYFDKYLDVFSCEVQGDWRTGGYCVYQDYLFLASPVSHQVLSIQVETGEVCVSSIGRDHGCGCSVMVQEGEDIWMLPFRGTVITRWNPRTEEVREYTGCPESFQCSHPVRQYTSMDRPFSGVAFYGDDVYLSPFWGDRYLCLNKQTGVIREWVPPFEAPSEFHNGYYVYWTRSYFLYPHEEGDGKQSLLFSAVNRKLYRIDFETGECREIIIQFDKADVYGHEPGFQRYSEWLQYACMENAVNSLQDFLDGKLKGNPFDKERQIQAFKEIAANSDGTSGQKIYQFARGQIRV